MEPHHHTPLVLMQHSPGASDYDDEVGVQYHYPKQYFDRIKEGSRFVYCRPREGKSMTVYFGAGTIGHITEDATRDGHKYCEILDYSHFEMEVPYRDPNGIYLESGTRTIPVMQNAVRVITDENFRNIVERGGLSPLEKRGLEIDDSVQTATARIKAANESYRDASPKEKQRLRTWIERGTLIGGEVKKMNKYVCQVCRPSPFTMKSGKLYAEAHHVIPLEKKEPGSLASNNVICVCANCHRKMHYGNVEIASSDDSLIIFVVDGKQTEVKRNRI